MSKDLPITRFTSVDFTANPNSPYNGFFVPQLTQTEINNILADPDRIGGIIFNKDTQELQTYSAAQQWVNIATSGGDSDFENIDVTDTTTTQTLEVTGTATIDTLNVTDSIVADNLTVTDTTTTQTLEVSGVGTIDTLNVTDTTTTRRLFGTSSSKPTFELLAGGTNGIASIAGSELAGVFGIGYTGVVGVRPTSVIAKFTLANPMPGPYAVIFTPSTTANFDIPTCPFTQQAYIQKLSQSEFFLISGPDSTIPDSIYQWNYIIIGSNI
jgi:hypothetical protein